MRISDWSSDVCSSDLAKAPLSAEKRGHQTHQKNSCAPAARGNHLTLLRAAHPPSQKSVKGTVRRSALGTPPGCPATAGQQTKEPARWTHFFAFNCGGLAGAGRRD